MAIRKPKRKDGASVRSRLSDTVIYAAGAAFCGAGFLLLHEGLAGEVHTLAHELFAAALATIFTTVALNILMRSQAREDREKEFYGHVFQVKLRMFEQLLTLVFAMDDDEVITEQEIREVENHGGAIALIAGEAMVATMAQFMHQLKLYGRLYFRDLDDEQKRMFFESVVAKPSAQGPVPSYLSPHKRLMLGRARKLKLEDSEVLFVSLDELVQSMRDDLSVVTGNVEDVLSAFVLAPYDAHRLIRTPNLVK
jgi:hypothetical protein